MTSPNTDPAATARTRHFIVSLLRIFGGLLTILGIALFNGQVAPLGGGADRWVGGVLIVSACSTSSSSLTC